MSKRRVAANDQLTDLTPPVVGVSAPMAAMAKDGFSNLVLKLGDGSVANQAATYTSNGISRNYQLLVEMYRSSWIVANAVDAVAEDMTRAGIDLMGIEPEEEARMQRALTRMGIWQAKTSGLKWGRLLGGSAEVLMVRGQALASPLLNDRVSKDQFEGLMVFDRRELTPDPNARIVGGMDAGLPEYYDVAELGLRIHHSRVVRNIGRELPRNELRANSWWGMSIVEPLYDRLVNFDTATAGSAALINKAHLRMVSIEKLREILAGGGIAEENLVKMFAFMAQLQSNQGITLLDSKDQYEAHSYTFSGLEGLLTQFAQQLSGATGIPLVRLLGQAPAGLNSTGEGDMRQYHENIAQQQEARLRLGLQRILDLLYRSLFGKPPPDDFDFSFNPLKQLDAKEKAETGAKMVDAVDKAYAGDLIDRATALKELQYIGTITGQFASVTPEMIAKVQAEIDAANEAPPGEGGELDPLTGLPKPPPPALPGEALDPEKEPANAPQAQ